MFSKVYLITFHVNLTLRVASNDYSDKLGSVFSTRRQLCSVRKLVLKVSGHDTLLRAEEMSVQFPGMLNTFRITDQICENPAYSLQSKSFCNFFDTAFVLVRDQTDVIS